ncbi:hypothetical protein MACH23_00770 [Sulfitobacter pontiacus]|nr:hypothetical protein MACH23_00770 [Sulfitobacter pontiacus]
MGQAAGYCRRSQAKLVVFATRRKPLIAPASRKRAVRTYGMNYPTKTVGKTETPVKYGKC